MCFKEIERNKYIYPHISHFWCSSFLQNIQVSIWYNFPSVWRTPFSISCGGTGLVATKSFFHLCSVILSFQVLTPLQFLPAYGHSPVHSENCGVFVFCPEFLTVFCRISSIQATPLLLEAANILRCQKSFKYSKNILGHVTMR